MVRWVFLVCVACFKRIQQNESAAMSKRVTTLKTEMLQAESQEADWQKKYARLKEQLKAQEA
jgi:hypothetical protein